MSCVGINYVCPAMGELWNVSQVQNAGMHSKYVLQCLTNDPTIRVPNKCVRCPSRIIFLVTRNMDLIYKLACKINYIHIMCLIMDQ
jgi:hypothetical protein